MKYLFVRQLLSLLIINVLYFPFYAEQSEPQEQTKESDDVKIIVLGMRHLPGTDGFNSDELQQVQSRSSDTARLLQTLPGVDIQAGGSVSGIPVVRGMADDRIRIKVDGMDLISACGNHMNPPLSYLDPGQVAEALVIASISPVSLGGDSIGSSIIIESTPPKFSDTNDGDISGKFALNWRTNADEFDSQLELNYALRELAFNYIGSFSEADNYHAGEAFKPAGPAARGRAELTSDEVGSSYYQATNHALKVAWQHQAHYWQFHYGEQTIPEQGWVNQRMDMTRNDSQQYNLNYEGDYDWGELSARVYQENTRHSMQFGQDKLFWYGPNNIAPDGDGIPCEQPSMGMNGCAGGMPMDTDGKNLGLVVAGQVGLSESEILRLGLELQRYTLDDYWLPSGKGMWPNTFVNINDGQRDRDAIYIEYEQSVSEYWQLQAGVRYEAVTMNAGQVQGYSPMMAFYGAESAAFNATDRRREDDNWDLTLMNRYTLNEKSSIEFGYGRKSRSPNLYERYTWSTGGMVMRMINMTGDGNGYVGNVALEPEVAHILSANWSWQEPNWSVSLSPHYSQVDNYIGARRCQSQNPNCGAMNQSRETGFVYLQYANESARLYGLDVSFNALLAEMNASSFRLKASYSLTRGKNRQTGDNLAQIMPQNIRLLLTHEYQTWQHSLELEVVDDKDRLSSVRNEIPTDSYELLHLRGNYTWSKHLQVSYGIENLLDKFYSHPLAGAYLGQGKTMSATGVAWGIPVPGMGRNLYLGLSYTF